jgi:predicted house-cleaning noncanonical NTP pyrophosphatase (MazG superfamily)
MNGKLVRDRIPEIIERKGGEAVTSILSDGEFSAELEKKLLEEVTEFQNDKTIEELADIVEVIHAIAKTMGKSFSDIENLRIKKRRERGGFDKKIFLAAD